MCVDTTRLYVLNKARSRSYGNHRIRGFDDVDTLIVLVALHSQIDRCDQPPGQCHAKECHLVGVTYIYWEMLYNRLRGRVAILCLESHILRFNGLVIGYHVKSMSL